LNRAAAVPIVDQTLKKGQASSSVGRRIVTDQDHTLDR
jgi:hypothetical protein